MNRTILQATAIAVLSIAGLGAQAQISIVTTDTNTADIARRVGGNRVRVESLSRGVDDPHHVEPRPSMVLKLRSAKVFVRIGMDLDGWADAVLEKAGNPQVMRGGKGYCDCSQGIRVQEIPPAKLDPSMGDIHVYGNPHYLMDPANGIQAANNVAAALSAIDPGGRSYYGQQLTGFAAEVRGKLNGWRAALSPFRGREITTYHRSWVYFMARFGLKEYGTIEPKPGIPPSPGHVNNLLREMKDDRVTVMLIENFRSHRFPDLIARSTGAKAVYVPLAVEGEPGVNSYLDLFDTIVSRLAAALK